MVFFLFCNGFFELLRGCEVVKTYKVLMSVWSTDFTSVKVMCCCASFVIELVKGYEGGNLSSMGYITPHISFTSPSILDLFIFSYDPEAYVSQDAELLHII